MADVSTKYPAGGGSGLFAGKNPPHYITGAYYIPIGYSINTDGYGGTTATRVYYFPLTVWEARTFAGASVYNIGVGDNGKKIRLMVFNDNGASGGPGTLAKDFGEITLTGAAALRTVTSSWTAAAGFYWGAIWLEQSCTMSVMAAYSYVSAVGVGTGPNFMNYLGTITAPTDTAAYAFFYHYVDTAYGAAPATAVAPTGTDARTFGAPAGIGGIPAFYLKA